MHIFVYPENTKHTLTLYTIETGKEYKNDGNHIDANMIVWSKAKPRGWYKYKCIW